MDFLPQRGRIRFVLVSPSHPGNIGSAARAIKTMGFDRLYVVSPRHPEYRTDPDAIAFLLMLSMFFKTASVLRHF